MAEPALKSMNVEEFLRWDDGTERHYELVDGFPVAMAPPAAAHRMLSARLLTGIESALSYRRPCNALGEAGIVRPDRADTYFEADIAASCERHQFGQQALHAPFLIVEVLSPSTERHDRRVKVPVYRQIESIEEILLVASDDIYAEVHRRAGAQWLIEILRGRDAAIDLASVPLQISLADLYRDIAVDAAED